MPSLYPRFGLKAPEGVCETCKSNAIYISTNNCSIYFDEVPGSTIFFIWMGRGNTKQAIIPAPCEHYESDYCTKGCVTSNGTLSVMVLDALNAIGILVS